LEDRHARGQSEDGDEVETLINKQMAPTLANTGTWGKEPIEDLSHPDACTRIPE